MADVSEPSAKNRRLYQRAFLKVSTKSGTPYPCSTDDIESVTKPSFFGRDTQPILGRFLSMEAATTELECSLLPTAKLSTSTEAALKRLRKMLLLEHKDWGPDLVIKSFNDWDKVFFNRRLKRHVELCWRTEDSVEYWAKRGTYGHQLDQGATWRWAHAKIELNADRLLLKSTPRAMREGEAPVSDFIVMWGVFLHECCHAYLAVLSGTADDLEESAQGYDGGHGCYFQRCIYAVDRSSRALMGVPAFCCYGTKDYLPQKLFDVKNHKVIPRDPKMPILKRVGLVQMWKTCSRMARVLLRA